MPTRRNMLSYILQSPLCFIGYDLRSSVECWRIHLLPVTPPSWLLEGQIVPVYHKFLLEEKPQARSNLYG